jgi:hypothetical protein
MKQKIDDARRVAVEQSRIKLLKLRPDPGQASDRSKQRIERERPHEVMLACVEFRRNAALCKGTADIAA